MSDSVTVVTSRSWGSRLKGSFKGIFVGLILVVGSCWLLFKNEGRAVTRYKSLKEGAAAVVSVASDRTDTANEGKLVHLSGFADAASMLADREFGVSAEAIHLERTVEMYQWRESASSKTEKKTGGSTETTTTYSYSQGWSEHLVDSGSFQESAGHENPRSMPFKSQSFSARQVAVGAFQLSEGLIRRMRDFVPLPLSSTAGLPSAIRDRARVDGNGLYVGNNPGSPQIGDLRISFRKVPPGTVSVVARQSGTELSAYPTRAGSSIELLRSGTAGAEEMFEAAQQANKVFTWILRAAGFLLMLTGFRMILGPLSVMADVLPALGNLVEKGVTGVAAMLAAPLSLLVVAFAWIFHRPLLAVTILVVMGALLMLLLRRLRKARKETSVPLPPLPSSS